MAHHADTSVWVSFLNGVDSAATRLLDEWLTDATLEVGDLVAMEVLQGLRQERVAFVEEVFSRCGIVPLLSPAIALVAAANYRTLRRRGRTVCSTIDCLSPPTASRTASNSSTPTATSTPSKSTSAFGSSTPDASLAATPPGTFPGWRRTT